MENVLDIYEKPCDPRRPVICLDERPCRLPGDIMMPVPMKPGQVRKEDYHYERHGVCVVLMAVEPLAGRRFVKVTEKKTREDYAFFMKELERKYPKAEKITLVQDNLNTHNPSSFYEAFPAHEAFSLSKRFDMVYTPKKAGWLNMAEIELSALSRQCLDRRIDNQTELANEVGPWVKCRDRKRIRIEWSFSKSKAREKLASRYETIRKLS